LKSIVAQHENPAAKGIFGVRVRANLASIEKIAAGKMGLTLPWSDGQLQQAPSW